MRTDETRCLECELSEACLAEDFERVEQLLELGADPRGTGGCNTALHDALSRQNMRLSRLLLENGADPNRTASTFSVPLLVAIESGQPELSRLLLENGARPELVSWSDIVPSGDDPGQIRSALDARMDPNDSDSEHGRTALHLAAMYGYVESLEVLLQAGSDPTRHDAEGNTPLDLAIRNHRQDVAERLQSWSGE